MPANDRPHMADPIAALIAASKAATAGPLRTGFPMWNDATQTLDWAATEDWHRLYPDNGACDPDPVAGNYDYEEGGIVNEADSRYIIAAYDPALVPALEALQARVADLEAALAPLANNYIVQGRGTTEDETRSIFVTVADVRRARALLGRE